MSDTTQIDLGLDLLEGSPAPDVTRSYHPAPSTTGTPASGASSGMPSLEEWLGSEPYSETISFLENPAELAAFLKKLDRILYVEPAQAGLDLGIAFLEMEFYPVAIHLFTRVAERPETDEYSEKTRSEKISALCLLARAYIQLRKPFDALSRIQPLLVEEELTQEQKNEVFYLMGCAHELAKDPGLAERYFRAVEAVDRNYRDIQIRLANFR